MLTRDVLLSKKAITAPVATDCPADQKALHPPKAPLGPPVPASRASCTPETGISIGAPPNCTLPAFFRTRRCPAPPRSCPARLLRGCARTRRAIAVPQASSSTLRPVKSGGFEPPARSVCCARLSYMRSTLRAPGVCQRAGPSARAAVEWSRSVATMLIADCEEQRHARVLLIHTSRKQVVIAWRSAVRGSRWSAAPGRGTTGSPRAHACATCTVPTTISAALLRSSGQHVACAKTRGCAPRRCTPCSAPRPPPSARCARNRPTARRPAR